jgi:ubiquinone/menaquinone biosynthesis C-methylase UbiE
MQNQPTFAGAVPANYEKYLGPFLFEPYALDMVSRLQDKKYPQILELACGTGRVTAHLVKSVKHDSLTATDLNPDMIEVAKSIVTSDKITWQVADAVALPFEDNSFDAVVCQFGIMFFPDKLKGLQEAYRVLKPAMAGRPGGKLIFNTWDKVENNPAVHEGRQIIEGYFGDDPPVFYNIPFSMYDENELQSLMKDACFKNIKTTLVKKEAVAERAAGLAIGMVEGSPILLSITEKDPSLVEPIEKHVEKVLAEKFGNAPLKSKLQAWVCEGEK